jgi:predicted TIM-barrel fold metal-dependent hydrolase
MEVTVQFDIDVGDTYRQWAMALSDAELAERTELLDQLPAHIIDCHAHATNAESVGSLSAYGKSQARSSFPVWLVRHSDAMREFLYGERRVARYLMAHPFRGIDHRRANDYLLFSAGPDDRITLCGLPDDREYTVRQLRSDRFAALKMYPHYREPPYQRLDEYFPDWALAAAAAAGVPAIVHLPLPLADCIDNVLAVARRNQGTQLVLAHLGRQHAVDQVSVRAFEAAAALPQISADTSMVIEREVHQLALCAFGPHRVLYGSDEPFNLLRYTAFQHPEHGYRLTAKQPYHWLDEAMYEQYRHLAQGAHLVHLQVLRSLIEAVRNEFGAELPAVLQSIFHDNAKRVFAAN